MADRLARELIEQAENLIRPGERGRPTDADLRRAVSASYYALFHELTLLVAERLTRRLDPSVRDDVRRHFAHGALSKVCSHEADYDHRAVVTAETSRLALDLARDAVELLDEAAHGDDEVQIDALVALLALVGGGARG